MSLTAGGQGDKARQRRAQFEEAVKAEFTRIMAAGQVSPNEAAAQAMRRVTGLQPA